MTLTMRKQWTIFKKEHGVLAQKILKGRVPSESLRAILAHNYENTGVKPETTLDKALIAADAVSGLIVACDALEKGYGC